MPTLEEQYAHALLMYNKYKNKKGPYVITHNILWLKKCVHLLILIQNANNQ